MKLCSDRGTDGKYMKNLAGRAEGKGCTLDLGVEGKLILKCIFYRKNRDDVNWIRVVGSCK